MRHGGMAMRGFATTNGGVPTTVYVDRVTLPV
jgi:hypothetical protein